MENDNNNENGNGRRSNGSYRPSSELARRTAQEFDEFRRQTYIDLMALEQRSKTGIRWAIGTASAMIVAIGLALAGSYITVLQRVEHLSVRQDLMAEQEAWQRQQVSKLDERTRFLEFGKHK